MSYVVLATGLHQLLLDWLSNITGLFVLIKQPVNIA